MRFLGQKHLLNAPNHPDGIKNPTTSVQKTSSLSTIIFSRGNNYEQRSKDVHLCFVKVHYILLTHHKSRSGTSHVH